ncbi:MAG TPA: TolC family protein [Gammaproteobacteria bacterium]|nr:TolC family protein [Gammaproteobacteria bacterium]
MLATFSRLAATAAAAVACAGALAAPPPAAAPLTLRAAMEAALAGQPALQALARRREATAAGRYTAALRPPLILGAEVENVFGTGEASGTGGSERTLALSYVVELGGQRQARIELADARTTLAEAGERIAVLDLLASVAQRYITVAASQTRLDLAREAIELTRQRLATTERLVQAGRSPGAERARAQAALAVSRLELEHAEHELRAARVTLAATWGELEPDFPHVTAAFASVGDPGDLQALLDAVVDNPDITRFTDEGRLWQAELALAQARGRGEVRMTGGVRRLGTTGDNALVVGAAVPLFPARRLTGERLAAEAQARAVDFDREAALLQLRTALYGIYQERLHALEQVRMLRREVIPQLEQALTETRAAYLRGRYGYLEWSSAQQALLEARAELINAIAHAHATRVELERLAGAPLLDLPEATLREQTHDD